MFCYYCNLEKEANKINFAITQIKNIQPKCRICKAAERKQQKIIRYEANKEKFLTESKEYYLKHKEEISKRKQDNYKDKKEEILYKNKIYYEKNKAQILIVNKTYAETHKEDLIEYKKEYKQTHKKERNLYEIQRKTQDIEYKLRQQLSSSINKSLKNNNGSKNGESFKIKVDYTIQEFCCHIELQFEWWMSWANRGRYNPTTWDDNDPSTWFWQLDHIIPLSDLPHATMDEENFKTAWGLSNLRPLSAKQNILDGANRTRHAKKAA